MKRRTIQDEYDFIVSHLAKYGVFGEYADEGHTTRVIQAMKRLEAEGKGTIQVEHYQKARRGIVSRYNTYTLTAARN